MFIARTCNEPRTCTHAIVEANFTVGEIVEHDQVKNTAGERARCDECHCEAFLVRLVRIMEDSD